MTITFADARDMVLDATDGEWDGPGTHYASPDGYEDSAAYLVTVGAREWLADGDPAFAVLGDPQYMVDKSSGAIAEVVHIVDADRIEAMSPVTIT